MKLALGIMLLALPLTVYGNQFTAKVVNVSDGDTITVLRGTEQVRVRLAEIDCPEKGQPWGRVATERTKSLTIHREVIVRSTGNDRYGRTIGYVDSDGLNVNRALVASGDCWVYRAYSTDGGLLSLEKDARNQRLGLWGLPQAEQTPPWEWRRATR